MEGAQRLAEAQHAIVHRHPLGLGVIEGLTKVFYPEASSTVVFLIMAVVLLGMGLLLIYADIVAPVRLG